MLFWVGIVIGLLLCIAWLCFLTVCTDMATRVVTRSSSSLMSSGLDMNSRSCNPVLLKSNHLLSALHGHPYAPLPPMTKPCASQVHLYSLDCARKCWCSIWMKRSSTQRPKCHHDMTFTSRCNMIKNGVLIMLSNGPMSISSCKRFVVAWYPATNSSQVCQWYHVVIFTAGIQEYANPVIDLLDPEGGVEARYFREVSIPLLLPNTCLTE